MLDFDARSLVRAAMRKITKAASVVGQVSGGGLGISRWAEQSEAIR